MNEMREACERIDNAFNEAGEVNRTMESQDRRMDGILSEMVGRVSKDAIGAQLEEEGETVDGCDLPLTTRYDLLVQLLSVEQVEEMHLEFEGWRW